MPGFALAEATEAEQLLLILDDVAVGTLLVGMMEELVGSPLELVLTALDVERLYSVLELVELVLVATELFDGSIKELLLRLLELNVLAVDEAIDVLEVKVAKVDELV